MNKPKLWQVLTEDQWAAIRTGAVRLSVNSRGYCVVLDRAKRTASGRSPARAFAALERRV